MYDSPTETELLVSKEKWLTKNMPRPSRAELGTYKGVLYTYCKMYSMIWRILRSLSKTACHQGIGSQNWMRLPVTSHFWTLLAMTTIWTELITGDIPKKNIGILPRYEKGRHYSWGFDSVWQEARQAWQAFLGITGKMLHTVSQAQPGETGRRSGRNNLHDTVALPRRAS